MKIIPSIIAKNNTELNERFLHVKNISKEFQFDFMDGKFVKNKSLMFDFVLPRDKKYQAHLMIKNPFSWIEKNWKKFDLFIVHVETSGKDFLEVVRFLKSKNKKIGITISPRTRVSRIAEYLPFVSQVTVMTVTPGKYGARFLESNLKKVKEIRKLNKKVKIQLDGGINDRNISLIPKDIDSVVLGSYLQNADYPKDAIKFLKKKFVIK